MPRPRLPRTHPSVGMDTIWESYMAAVARKKCETSLQATVGSLTTLRSGSDGHQGALPVSELCVWAEWAVRYGEFEGNKQLTNPLSCESR
jgi:hypothetical protein